MGKIDVAEIERKILQIFYETFEEQTAGAKLPEITNDKILLEAGLDSLGVAILVTNLEEELDYDPFTISSDAFYPQTFSQLVQFYHENQPE